MDLTPYIAREWMGLIRGRRIGFEYDNQDRLTTIKGTDGEGDMVVGVQLTYDENMVSMVLQGRDIPIIRCEKGELQTIPEYMLGAGHYHFDPESGRLARFVGSLHFVTTEKEESGALLFDRCIRYTANTITMSTNSITDFTYEYDSAGRLVVQKILTRIGSSRQAGNQIVEKWLIEYCGESIARIVQIDRHGVCRLQTMFLEGPIPEVLEIADDVERVWVEQGKIIGVLKVGSMGTTVTPVRILNLGTSIDTPLMATKGPEIVYVMLADPNQVVVRTVSRYGEFLRRNSMIARHPRTGLVAETINSENAGSDACDPTIRLTITAKSCTATVNNINYPNLEVQ